MYSRLNLTVNQHQLPLHISFPLLNLHFNHLKDKRDFFPKTDHNMTMVRDGEINSTLFFFSAISVLIHKSTSSYFFFLTLLKCSYIKQLLNLLFYSQLNLLNERKLFHIPSHVLIKTKELDLKEHDALQSIKGDQELALLSFV